MKQTFVDVATAELRLNDAERTLVVDAAIRSFDEFHSVLRGSPSLARRMPDVRWNDLLKLLEPRLSDAYRKLRAGADEPEPAFGASFARDLPISPGPPPDWPALGQPESLTDAPAVDLLARNDRGWPPRDQREGLTCVSFAAAATLERRRRTTRTMAVERLAPIFLHNRIDDAGGLFPDGGTRLMNARETLGTAGICREPEWPDDKDPKQDPPAGVIQSARQRRDTSIRCWSLGKVVPRWPGPARAVHTLLAAGRPVAISIPVFLDPAGTISAWWSDNARLYGKVPEPLPGQQNAPLGHAVCVLAFQPDADAPGHGWFIFRNSVGTRWAIAAPNGLSPDPPHVPQPGYGAISAKHLNDHVVEIFAP